METTIHWPSRPCGSVVKSINGSMAFCLRAGAAMRTPGDEEGEEAPPSAEVCRITRLFGTTIFPLEMRAVSCECLAYAKAVKQGRQAPRRERVGGRNHRESD